MNYVFLSRFAMVCLQIFEKVPKQSKQKIVFAKYHDGVKNAELYAYFEAVE
jgi:hypothetical protein